MTMFGGSLSGERNAPAFLQQLSQINQESVEGTPPPSEAFLAWLHGQASTSKPQDLHHTLGFQETNASPGNHRHNGKDSLKIIPDGEFTLVDLTGSATTADIVAAVNKLNLMARTYLGAG